jgi:hypothetical protein
MDKVQNPVILSVIHHRQNPLESKANTLTHTTTRRSRTECHYVTQTAIFHLVAEGSTGNSCLGLLFPGWHCVACYTRNHLAHRCDSHVSPSAQQLLWLPLGQQTCHRLLPRDWSWYPLVCLHGCGSRTLKLQQMESLNCCKVVVVLVQVPVSSAKHVDSLCFPTICNVYILAEPV